MIIWAIRSSSDSVSITESAQAERIGDWETAVKALKAIEGFGIPSIWKKYATS